MSKHFFYRLKHGFASNLVIAVSLLGLFLFDPAPLEAMHLYVSFDEMTQQADAIFLGTVVDQQTRHGPNQKMIFTDVYFEVTKLIYSNEKSRALIGKDTVLTFAGGELGGEIVRVSGVPSLETDASYVVFARMDGRTYASPVIVGSQGLFGVIADEVTGTLYPLTYGGNCIVDIRDSDLLVGPPVARVLSGRVEEKVGKIPFKIHNVPPEPADQMDQGDAKAYVSRVERETPEKVMTLDEFIDQILRRIQRRKEVGS